MSISEESTVLSSWKDIAKYLGKGVRTVQRWERQLGLPVRRPVGATQKSAVVLYRGDVDAWLATRFSSRTLGKNEMKATQTCDSARSNLREGIRRAHALRMANQALTEQIAASIRQLAERCDRLTNRTLRAPVLAHFELPAEEAGLEMTGSPELLPGSRPVSDPVSSERIA